MNVERHPFEPFLPNIEKKAAAYRRMFEDLGMLE